MEEQLEKYEKELYENYKQFAEKITEIIEAILKENNIKIHSIDCRAKDPRSLKEKISRKGKEYNGLSDITDLAGVRIITYFPDDVDRIIPYIEETFKIDRQNSEDKRKKDDPYYFGYASVHYVVQLIETYNSIPVYTIFKSMKCEIQIRTILQHAWAEIEHDIVYKKTFETPNELLRRFSSLSGMLEIADREFKNIRELQKVVRENIEESIKVNDFDLPINYETVEKYFIKYYNGEKLSPETIRKLVFLLDHERISSIKELDDILKKTDVEENFNLIRDKVGCDLAYTCEIKYILKVAKKIGVQDEVALDIAGCYDCRLGRLRKEQLNSNQF